MKESLIKRTKRVKNFTHLGNEIFASNLSPESLGILCYILHLPDDWIVRKKQLMSHFSIGRDKVNNVFKELKEAGYIAEVIKIRGNGGKFDGVNYVVYDSPFDRNTEKPYSGKPVTGEPLTGNQYTGEPHNGKTTTTKNYPNKELIVPITNLPKTNIKVGTPEFDRLSAEEKEAIDGLWFMDPAYNNY
jgi:hypothetical protein